jgi:ribosomal-protein-alanine N-acetyltransferase
MRLRPAEFGDIPRLMEIERQSPSAAHWSEREYGALFSGACGDESGQPRRVCLVAETELAVAGFVVALCLGSEWEIENLVVDSAFLRRGYGTVLLRELLSRAANEGARRVLLEVRESNQVARAFYDRWGFKASGRRRRYYRDPVEDAILLQFMCNNDSFQT